MMIITSPLTSICSFEQMNQFHWHIVDSQSFPLQVPGYLEISEKGAYSADEVYSPKDVAEVVQYAAAVRDSPDSSTRVNIDVSALLARY
jgi:hypothetical protein